MHNINKVIRELCPHRITVIKHLLKKNSFQTLVSKLHDLSFSQRYCSGKKL